MNHLFILHHFANHAYSLVIASAMSDNWNYKVVIEILMCRFIIVQTNILETT